MTYQTTTAPSFAVDAAHRALGSVGSFFRAIGHAIMVNSSAQRRLDRVHALRAKSDAELATLKIKREDIVHEVFRDLYYV